jgi:hypothetical protein
MPLHDRDEPGPHRRGTTTLDQPLVESARGAVSALLPIRFLGPLAEPDEIELSCLTKQCLGRRLADLDILNAELDSWTDAINADERQVDWRFTTRDARIKLRHLYPVL